MVHWFCYTFVANVKMGQYKTLMYGIFEFFF